MDLSFTRDDDSALYRELPNDGAYPLLEAWFSRAKARPLSLTLRSLHKTVPLQILSLISSISTRLYRLELLLSSADFRFLQQNPIELPHLQRLGLYIPSLNDPDSLIRIFENTPTLPSSGHYLRYRGSSATRC